MEPRRAQRGRALGEQDAVGWASHSEEPPHVLEHSA